MNFIFSLDAFSWKTMELTASPPTIYAFTVCRRECILRRMHSGLAQLILRLVRPMRIALVIAHFALVGCAEIGAKIAGGDKVASVKYYDFNGDGRSDFEFHERPLINGVVGFQWSRRDTNYDGYYDKQTEYGATISVSEDIRIPVPRIDFGGQPRPKRS